MIMCFNVSLIIPTNNVAYATQVNRNTPKWDYTNNTSTDLGNVTSDGTERPFSNESEAWLVVLFTFTTLMAITGNSVVILVFARGRRSRTDLRPFLINLAVSDLIMAIFCMPFTFIYTTLTTWIFSKAMCPIVLFVQLLSVFGSVFTNMAIGIDRFLAVLFPLRSRITKNRAKYVILAIWILNIGLCSVQFKVGQAVEIRGGVIKCVEVWASASHRKTYTVVLFVMAYVIPLLALSITYSIIGFLLWKRTSPGNRHQVRDLHQLRSKRKIVKMLITVVAMFGICWFPLHLFTLMIDFYPDIDQKVSIDTLTGLYIGAHWLAMSNSFANPIVYGFTNEGFRADFVTLLYMCCPCCFCLTKILTRQPSGSSIETVVFKRPSFRRQKSRTSNEKGIQNKIVFESRDSRMSRKRASNRQKLEYEEINASQRNKNVTLSNGCNNVKMDSKNIDTVYFRLEHPCRSSVSVTSNPRVEET